MKHNRPQPFLWLLVILYIAAIGMHVAQNNMVQLGGEVAFVKVLWLVTAIFLWFLLPVFIFRSQLVPPILKRWLKIFWAFMVLRGVVELYMMYVSVNWHPYYGIAHDFASILILFAACVQTRVLRFSPFSAVWYSLPLVIVTLVAEIGFAWYMLHNVISDKPIYYVPAEDKHQFVLLLTWIMVAFGFGATVYLAQFWPKIRRRPS